MTKKLITPQATRRKAKRFENQLRSYTVAQEQAELASIEDFRREAAERDAKVKEVLTSTLAKAKQTASKQMEDYDEIFHRNFANVLTSLMALVTTEAVLLDDEDVNKDDLFESFKEAYSYLYENDQISLAASPTFEKLGGRAVSYVGSADEVLSDEQISNIVSSIYVNDPEMINPLINTVQEKVASCIKEEKKSILAKQNLSEDQILVEQRLRRKSKTPLKPLFRKLLEDGISSSMNVTGTASLSEEAATSVMENSLTGAIATYTLLECLNTSKLAAFSDVNVRGFINYS